MIRALAVACALIALTFVPISPASHAQIEALTIGAAIQSLSDLANQLENAAQSLIQQGNTALAQQQMLAAGILKQLINQLSTTYKGRLDDTFEKLGTAQSNVANDVSDVLSTVKRLEKGTTEDAQATIYKMQGGVNQILNKLPLVSHEPIFYGMLVHDIYSPIPKKGFDLELLGLNLTDEKLSHKNPLVTVAGDAIPNQNISVQEDRVQISLPDSIKQKIGFRTDYCLPPTSFAVSMQTFYVTRASFIFIPINKNTSETFNAFALRSPDIFTAKVRLNGIVRTISTQSSQFSAKSASVSYGCEESNSGSVAYTVPDGATEINCTVAWVDQTNTKGQTASCHVGGSTVVASGTANGRDRECIVSDILSGGLFKTLLGRKTVCNCPGGGHGALLLQGTYKVTHVNEGNFVDDSLGVQRFIDEADLSLPSDNSKQVKSINVSISRPQCDKEIDNVNMTLPTDPTAIASQSSANGLFKATYRAEHLRLDQTK
jgi:hypothetical protein